MSAQDSRSEGALTVSFALMATLTVVITLTPYTVDSFLPSFPGAAAAYGVAPSTVQLTLTAFLIGIASGQLVFGPISDRLGRRGPLIVGAAVCAAAAVLCALAPTATVLIIGRFIQGFAGASGMVISKAIIRDRTVGTETARVLALTAMGAGALNIFSPLIGGILVQLYGWRGPLWFIAVASVVLLIIIIVVLPETHAHEHRSDPGGWLGLASVVVHLRNRPFLVLVVIQALSYATLMAYVASSPFVYQRVLGFDGFTYGLLFTVTEAALVVANLVASRLVRVVRPKVLVATGLSLCLAGVAATLVASQLGAAPLVIAACITLSVAPLGLNGPNLIGLALNRVSHSTGSAAATLGFVQFCSGAIASPIVGLWGTESLLPMALTMASLAGISFVLLLASRARPPRVGFAA